MYASAPLLGLLGVLNIFNLLDWRLTMSVLERGAIEANPIMAPLLEANPLTAGLFKIAVMLLVSLAIWNGRRYRRILEFAVVATACYAALLVYQVVGLTVVLPAA